MRTLTEALDAQKNAGLERQRLSLDSAQGRLITVNGQSLLSFCSNDYLGLAADERIVEAFQRASKHYGLGSGASHLICGHSRAHTELEEAFAEFTGQQRALLFGSGYLANLGVVTTLARTHKQAYHDRLNHASLLDGSRLAGQRLRRYPHRDHTTLGQWLEQQHRPGPSLIATDGVFSMDGDLAPLAELIQLAEKNGSHLYLDDAHAFGVIGKEGGGSCCHWSIDQASLPTIMATLGKAFGCYGAIVAGSHDVIESLIQFSRPYTYTTALPAAMASAAMEALSIMRKEQWRRDHLADLINHFYAGAETIGLPLPRKPAAAIPIIPIIIGDSEQTVALSEALQQQEILLTGIRPPTVPEGQSRLRLTFSALHRQDDIDRLLDAFKQIL